MGYLIVVGILFSSISSLVACFNSETISYMWLLDMLTDHVEQLKCAILTSEALCRNLEMTQEYSHPIYEKSVYLVGICHMIDLHITLQTRLLCKELAS